MELPIICRACLADINVEYIDLDTPFNNTTVLETFNYCTKLGVSLDDGFPTSICIPCFSTLQSVCNFIKTACETDRMLRICNGTEKVEMALKIEDDSEIISDLKEVPYNDVFIEKVDNVDVKEEKPEILNDILSSIEETIAYENNQQKHSFQDYFESIACIPRMKNMSQDLESNAPHSSNESEHREDEHKYSIPKEKNINVKKVKTEKHSYICDTCEKSFKTMLSRNRHEFLEHKNDDSQERKCKLCEFSTSSLQSWQTHRYRHENPPQKKYLCSYCPKKFVNPKSLLMHEDYYHGTKERASTCEKCGKKFMNKQKLEYHILSAHSNGRNYQCPECPKTFKNNFQLRAHKKLHTERTIDCPECEKKFLRHVDLKVHMRTHTGELPYECHLCDKRYRIRVRLTYHLQRHLGTKHKCELCYKEFNSKPKLRLHMFEHIGMPFVCDHCQTGFKTRLGISRHSKAVHDIILTNEELLQNRLKNEKNINRGIVSKSALLDHCNAESELDI